eukprot:gi/632990268/ref/XP_007884090.1/ PREDICTED: cytosolic carboxypeptidase 3-like [Callorhinchus milii]
MKQSDGGSLTSEEEDEMEATEDSEEEFEEKEVSRHGDESIYEQLGSRTTQLVLEKQFGREVRRLRKPRDLYGLSALRSAQVPCWPQECEVLKERIRHIGEWGIFPEPEPLYKPTGQEQSLECLAPEEGLLVYVSNKACKEPYFTYSRVGGSPRPLRQATYNVDKQSDTLLFEARFESGNLHKAFKVGDYDYELLLRADLYTNKHTQWYYFQVGNMQRGVCYRFTITNLLKPTSLYSAGMRPLMYSVREAEERGMGWHRVGTGISYYRNNRSQASRQCYSLTWKLCFPHSGDTCYFAHCYPFTYSDLQDYLAGISSDPVRSRYCKLRVLCRSLGGNMVYVLTVTNPSRSPQLTSGKKAVVVTARVHPGETNSSWVMKGFLDYLLGGSEDASLLRDMFLFKVVPMLNPDGVVVGNYRCSLAGQDLNRNYRTCLKQHFPPVWYMRNLIKR